MLRTFTATLLASAAFARGDSTGLDDQNSVTTNLITNDDMTLDIHTYSKNEAGQLDFHADLTLAVLTGQWSNFEFGFCLSRDETNWDCMRSRGNYDPDQGSTGTVLLDGYYTGAADDFLNFKFKVDDETAETDQNKWLFTEAKSFSNCTKTSRSVPGFANITCTGINQHFQRNYQTDQKTQDLQLTLEDADATIKGFGWAATYAKTDFTGQASWSSTDDTVVVDVTTVSQDFKTQETAPVEDDNTDEDNGGNGSENTEEENQDDLEDDDESDPDTDDEQLCDKDDAECDSASQLTLSAAAALATLFTLNF